MTTDNLATLFEHDFPNLSKYAQWDLSVKEIISNLIDAMLNHYNADEMAGAGITFTIKKEHSWW